MDKVVIVGAGLAAAHCIGTLREEGYTGAITLFGQERHLPYERPQLSKDMLKGSDFAPLHDEQWYADRGASRPRPARRREGADAAHSRRRPRDQAAAERGPARGARGRWLDWPR